MRAPLGVEVGMKVTLPLRFWGRLGSLATVLCAATSAAGDSVAGSPNIYVRCAGVTHLAVGARVPLSLLEYREHLPVLCKGMTFAADPSDVAEVTPDGHLVGRRPGRVNVTATLPGVGTSLPRTLWVVETLEGGTLPRLAGLTETQEWEFDWWVAGDDGQSGLRLSWEGREHSLWLGVPTVPPGPPPWSIPLEPSRTRYGPLDPLNTGSAPTPRRGTLHVDAWTAGVARGRVEIEQADGKMLVVDYVAALPPPIHPRLVEGLVSTQEEKLSLAGASARSVRARPRGAPATRRLLLVPPATGLDDAVVRSAQQFAARGFDVRAIDVYAGATAPDPTVLAEGHVPRDRAAARSRAAIARAMNTQQVHAVLVRALEVLAEPEGPKGKALPRGVVAWGEACAPVARAVAEHPGIAGSVLIDPDPAGGEVLLNTAIGSTCFVLGTRSNAAAGDLATALRHAWPPTQRAVEVHVVPTAEPGFSDPRWHLGYGAEATQAAHARLLAFLDRRVR
jgi:dienelactone hydrolase